MAGGYRLEASGLDTSRSQSRLATVVQTLFRSLQCPLP